MLKGARRKECDGATSLIKCFSKLAADFWLRVDLPPTHNKDRHQAAAGTPRLWVGHHPGITRDHPGSRERKAALTLGSEGGEPGQISGMYF